MSDEGTQSTVELTIGKNNLRIEGTEGFISQQLSTILDRIDLGSQPQTSLDEGDGSEQATFGDVSDNGTSVSEKPNPDNRTPSNIDPQLSQIAERVNVKPESLAEHFYLDGEDIHIQNPRNIEPKYALLGYCTVKEEMTEEPYHDNTETKKKLIDVEKVDIDDWGGVLLHSLRQGGYIKDDPHSQKKLNRPFKITPPGRGEFIDWLNEDD